MDKLVMSKDRVVARFDAMNHLVWKDEDLCPLHIKRTENLDGWLASRAIDSHRPNSRLLKKALRLAERDDVNTVLSVHAVTVTDTYWVKNADSDLTWDDVRFQKDYFSTLALKGDYNSFTSANKSEKTHTQELTNIGSFEKCWRLKDGVWWLYKQADAQELFSEYFICLLGKRLGCALPGFVDSKNEEKTERNAGYLVVSQSGGGMLRQGTRKGIRGTPANRGMRAHRVIKSLNISENVRQSLCP